MSEEKEGKKIINIELKTKEIQVSPGNSIAVPVLLSNHGAQGGEFQLIIEGIPLRWVSITSTIIYLDAGEKKQVTIAIQPPLPTETGPGVFQLVLRIVNRQDSSQTDRVEAKLTVAAKIVEGRLGVMMEATKYTVSPGGNVIVQLSIRNQGLVDDEFRLSVEDIPIEWVSTPQPVIPLKVGEQHKVILNIMPPPPPDTPAGQMPFKIQFISHQVPDQPVVVDCTLMVMAVNEFECTLKPDEIREGQEAFVAIKNKGNIADTYQVSLESEENIVAFEPPGEQQIQIAAGEQDVVEYKAKPNKRPFIGDKVNYPFTASVEATKGEKQTLKGNLIAEPIIPFWVLPIVLIVCLLVICLPLGYYFIQGRSEANQATQTAALFETMTAIAGGGIVFTPTYEIVETPTFTQVPSAIPTEAPTEVPTAVPSETPLPSPTTTEIPTEVPTAVPSDTPVVIPNVGMIAFQSNRDGNQDLYTQDTGTGAITPLTNSPANDTQVAYSPNGNQIVFTSNANGNNEIYLANSDGTHPINITNNSANDQMASWSPDGAWIIFTTNRDGNYEIYIMHTDGTNLQNLTNNPADDLKPTWLEVGEPSFLLVKQLLFNLYEMVIGKYMQ